MPEYGYPSPHTPSPRLMEPSGRFHRREILRAGGAAAFGLTLPQWLASRSCEATSLNSIAPQADRCIVLFLNGGPSHLDMWDMKPQGPVDIRGEFNPIASSIVGEPVCEHLPRLATNMHRVTVIRSMNHSVNNAHAAAVYAALTGHDRGELGGGAKPTDHPSPGSVLAKLRPSGGESLPYVALPYKTKEGAGGPLQPGFLAGFMGPTYDPFWVLNDPNAPNFQVQNLSLPADISPLRMQDRTRLLSGLGRRLTPQPEASLGAMDSFQQQAFDLLTSKTAQEAFQLERETDSTRERYGRNIYGQSALLGRRLLEAGTRFVTLSWAPDANATWDTHGNNFNALKNTLLPQFDAACSSLLEDLDDRGMLERTLVAVLGDFGRTPKINTNAGRDHWNACYSIVLAGGGIQAGTIFGQSDRMGGLPIESPVTPGDVIATVYRLLGVDSTFQLYDSLGRPHEVVPQGRILHEIMA
jgi:hypothetical protein